MNTLSIILGYLFSTVVSTLVMWILIDKLAWPYILKDSSFDKKPGILTLPMGIVERVLYTTAFLANAPTLVGFWIALKVATKWGMWTKENRRGPYNIFLIGTALSLLLSYLGAILAAQKILIF